MCTVSWTTIGRGYELFFNRDELHTRAAEQPPQLAEHNGIAYAAPRDGDYGGSWITVNECGVTVCLLNDYVAAWRPAAGRARLSRGHIVTACASAVSHSDIVAAVRAQPLPRAGAFQLLAIVPGEGPLVLHWNGARLVARRSDVVPPLTSSSFAPGTTAALRMSRFCSVARSPNAPTVAELREYHHQHSASAGADSVLMRRTDGSTRSITHVAVDSGWISLNYQPVRWTSSGPLVLSPTCLMLARRRSVGLAA